MAEHVLEEVVVLVPEEPLGGCGAVGSARKVVVDTGESFQVFCADMVCPAKVFYKLKRSGCDLGSRLLIFL